MVDDELKALATYFETQEQLIKSLTQLITKAQIDVEKLCIRIENLEKIIRHAS